MDPYTVFYVVGLPAGACLLWCYETYAEYREHRKLIRREKQKGWTYIGKVEFVCVYPIDGGRALKEEQAYVGQFGLRTDPVDSKAIYDRGYVVYSKSTNPPSAILRHQTLSRKSKEFREINQLWSLLKSISGTIAPTSAKQVKIQYIHGMMSVLDVGDSIAKQVKRAFNFPEEENIRLGYYPQDFKKTFNHNTKAELLNADDGNYCLVNYASITMVNSASVEDLRKETGRSDLSYKNFRPQIVFKGIRSYVEDGVREIKIGDLEFSNVTACVYRDDINFSFKSKKPRNRVARFFMGNSNRDEREVQYTEPFRYLEKYRHLGKLDTHFVNSIEPSFGLNFQCDIENEDLRYQYGVIENDLTEDTPNVIRKGYNVFVKY